MKRYTVPLAVVACVGAALLALPRHPQADHRVIPASRAAYDPLRATKTVAFYEAAVQRDPQGSISYAMLAGAYLKRANETGDLSDIRKAEAASRKSLSIRTKRNAAAYLKLSQSLVAQHRFAEALGAARQADRANGGDTMAQRLQADILFELGRYAEAKAIMRRQGPVEDPGGLAQRSRFALLHGKNDESVDLLRRACRKVDHALHLSPEEAAWIHTRLGVALTTIGRAEEADREYETALRLFPGDYKTLTFRADLAASRNDWARASEYASRAIAIERTPEAVALLGDCRAAQGDRAEAERLYREVEKGLDHTTSPSHAHSHQHRHDRHGGTHQHNADRITPSDRGHGHTHDRHLILFCADHDRHLGDALALARQELTVRQDIYTYDALAWTLYRLGRFTEADAASRKALSQGTKDARILFHAGMIAQMVGQGSRSAKLLKEAHRTNPLVTEIAAAQRLTRQ
jgi:tetratricopeptide (TPR) repeat protein